MRAILFTDRSGLMAPLIPAWTGVGHDIAAIVLPARDTGTVRALPLADRLGARRHWSLEGMLADHAPGARMIALDPERGWDEAATQIEALRPDLLISALFQHRVPAGVLSLCALGGVNLHPARLPAYRGIRPVQHMLLNRDWETHGGMTLHLMDDRFDTGPVIGRAEFPREAWGRPASLNAAMAGAACALVRDVLPRWCAGEIGAMPQPEGRYPEARAGTLCHAVRSEWTLADLHHLSPFFRRKLYVDLDDGRRQVVGQVIRRTGPPTGAPPALADGWLAFDLSDGRVAARGLRWHERLLRRRRSWRRMAPIPPAAVYDAAQVSESSVARSDRLAPTESR